MTEEKREVITIDDDGTEYFDDELALAEMLNAGVMKSNTGFWPEGGKNHKTVVLFVNCNDVFAWAQSDGECFTHADIEPLYRLHKQGAWGSAKWCCIHRNEKPQAPVEKLMKDAGLWDDVMDALPENYYGAAWRKTREEKANVSLA